MLIEIHMLKNYPPVNLNRDDSGAPKTCFFGGVQRGRISSQCLKRSWRTSETFHELESFSVRTRSMPVLVGKRLGELGIAPDFVDEAVKKLTGIANKDGTQNKKANITTQIVIYSQEEIERIVQAVKAAIEEDGDIKTFLKRSPKEFDKLRSCAVDKPVTADIALFGRMVTSPYLADVDAAMQVAHAISTHAVNRESDYFTAVDDLIGESEEDSGAGMIGDVDYISRFDTGKIEVHVKPENMPEVMAVVNAHPSENYICVKTFEGPNHVTIEFIDPHINKGLALRKFSEKHDIPLSEFIAFGDMENDIDLLKESGWGVCMINGSDTVKAIAQDVTEYGVTEDGVGRYLFKNWFDRQ